MTEGVPPIDASLRDEVFTSTIGRVPASAAADLRTYFLEVHRYCVRWINVFGEHGQQPAGASAFVLSERLDLDPVYEEHAGEFSAVGRLDADPPPVMPGPIVLTSRNLRLAFARECDDTHVIGIVQELRSLGLADRPTAIFLPSERALSFYPYGVDDKPSLETDTAALAGLDPSDILSLVNYFHEHWTRFPDGFGACWDNASLRIVERNAERNIRNALFVFLSMVVYRTQYVAREHQLSNGRVDIFIYGVVLADEGAHHVLELKVLRSRSSGWRANAGRTRSYGEPGIKRYVERGLRQAQRYKAATNAAEAFLLCFDARLEGSEIDVHTYASTLGVEYRRYFMESSVSEAQ